MGRPSSGVNIGEKGILPWLELKKHPDGCFSNSSQDGTSPSGKISDEIFLQAGLAVFAFCGLRTLKQKHRSAFRSPTDTKQLVSCLGWNKKSTLTGAFLTPAKTGDRTPDLSLTKRLLYQLSYLGNKSAYYSYILPKKYHFCTLGFLPSRRLSSACINLRL